MNTKRLVVLGFAGVMAIAAALLARGMMGGGTPKAEAKIAPPIAMSEVLVANAPICSLATRLPPIRCGGRNGQAASVDSSFITRKSVASIDDVGERHRGARAADRRPAHHQSPPSFMAMPPASWRRC